MWRSADLVILSLVLFPSHHAVAQVPPPPTAAADAKPQPRIHVAERVRDLGSIIEGEKTTITWKIENQGQADLIIDRTQSTCGCTVVRLDDKQKIIAPGGSIEMKAEFDSKGRRGDQHKTVAVFTNDTTEPDVNLSFQAKVSPLFDVDPPGLLNLRAVQRGQPVENGISIFPAAGRSLVEIIDVKLDGESPLTFEIEPVKLPVGTGQRVKLRLAESAALGSITASASIRFKVDGIEREWNAPVRAEVIGDLTWTPQVLDATRQTIIPGRALAPVTIRSTNKTPFEVTDATAGAHLDVTFEQLTSSPARSASSVYLRLREGAPPGPFATMLSIQTTSLDQPVIQIPVFGMVLPPLQAEPPMVLMRPDGTPAGTERRIRLLAEPNVDLKVTKVSCDHPAIVAAVDQSEARRQKHLQFLKVKLTGAPPADGTQAMLHVDTNIPGYETFDIPLVIEAKKR